MSPSAISSVRAGRLKAITAGSRAYARNGSAVTRQHVIGQREERVALGARRKHVEMLLGALGVFDSAAVGVIDRGVLAKAAQQLGPLLLGDAARGDDVAHDLRGDAVALVPLQMNQRQRDFPFAQVAADWLADDF